MTNEIEELLPFLQTIKNFKFVIKPIQDSFSFKSVYKQPPQDDNKFIYALALIFEEVSWIKSIVNEILQLIKLSNEIDEVFELFKVIKKMTCVVEDKSS